VLVYFLSVQNPKTGLRTWGRIGLILSVLLILTTNAFMGFTRERARKPYLIYGVVYGNQLMTDMMEKMMGGTSEVEETPDGVGDAAEGQVVFESGICTACHSIGGVGGTVKALDGIGTRRNGEEILALLDSPPTGMPPYSGSSEEKAHLVAFLESLK
jgi:hypothetical protein